MLLRRYGLAQRQTFRSLASSKTFITSASLVSRGFASSPTTLNDQAPDIRDIAILGGGISGLATAYYITRTHPKTKITIYEAGPRIGGWLSSRKATAKDGSEVLFEAGPRTLRPNGNGVLAARLIHELGLVDDTIFTFKSSAAATNRYVYYPDHLMRVPVPQLGIWNMIKTIIQEPALEGLPWGLISEGRRNVRDNDGDESIGSFLGRRLGSNLVDRVVSAVFHGIYAGDIYQLSAKSLLPTQWRDELEQGSLTEGILKSMFEGPEMTEREAAFMTAQRSLPQLPEDFRKTFSRCSVFTFQQGLEQLVTSLVKALAEHGSVTMSPNTKINEISSPSDGVLTLGTVRTGSSQDQDSASESTSHTHVISTLSPGPLSKILEGDRSASALQAIPAVTVMTVNLYFATPNLNPPGFGYLIPLATPMEQNPERALGVVFDSSYAPDPSEASEHITGPNQDSFTGQTGTKLTVMLGGHYWSGWPAYPSEEEGLAMARSLLERHLGITEEPQAYMVNLQSDCIPQYTVGHENRLKTIHEALHSKFQGRLRVGGNWIRGVGVNDCLRTAWDLARELPESRTGLEPAVESKQYVRIKPVK